MQTPRLFLPMLAPAQAAKHITVNEALISLDAVVQLTLSGEMDDPPVDPPDGLCVRVGASPTSAFTGRAGQIAARASGQWRYLEPQTGWRAWDTETERLIVFDGAGWVNVSTDDALTERVVKLGVDTDADATNVLSVRGDGTLLSAGSGGSHRLSVNRATTQDAASILFQTGFTGEAEIGLTQGGALAFRANTVDHGWTDALSVDPASGRVSGIGLSSGQSVVRVIEAGSGTYDVPDGVIALDVVLQGAGGGGAGVDIPTTSTLAGAGGGGAGGYVRTRITGDDLQGSYAYVVGAGGAGGLAAPAPGDDRSGADGDSSQFGSGVSLMTAAGGGGAPERTASGGYRIYLSGDGGAASGGDVAIVGQPGSGGTTYGSRDAVTGSASGGSSLLGRGGSPGSGDGADGTGYGAGGAGAGFTPGIVSAAAGGDGADGVLIITEYY